MHLQEQEKGIVKAGTLGAQIGTEKIVVPTGQNSSALRRFSQMVERGRLTARLWLVHDASRFYGFVADAAGWLRGQEGGPSGSSTGGVGRVKIGRSAEVEEVTHVSILQPIGVPGGEGRDGEGLLNEGQDCGG